MPQIATLASDDGAGAAAALPTDPSVQAASTPASITGTVEDTNGDLVPAGVATLLTAGGHIRRTSAVKSDGSFLFDNLDPRQTYRVQLHVEGFADWSSPEIAPHPGELFLLTDIHMRVLGQSTSVTVFGSQEQIATEQVHLEMQQRVLGIVPNFYVSYDPNAAALTTKLKFKLAVRTAVDPVTLGSSVFLGAIQQAGDFPGYGQGWRAYGQRIGADMADESSDILIGGAILPALLHQDPRYFYQGTGSVRSRAMHAMSNPFLCRGDNGKRQINFSTIGGDIGSSMLSTLYYPKGDRGSDTVAFNVLISTTERIASSLIQEFVLGKFTSRGKPKE